MWIQYLSIWIEEAIYRSLSTSNDALSRYQPVMHGDQVFVVVFLSAWYGNHPPYVQFSSPCLETCSCYSSNQSAFALYVSCWLYIHSLATRLVGNHPDCCKAVKSTWQLLQWRPMGVLSFDGMLLSIPFSFILCLVCIFRIFFLSNKHIHMFGHCFLHVSNQ